MRGPGRGAQTSGAQTSGALAAVGAQADRIGSGAPSRPVARIHRLGDQRWLVIRRARVDGGDRAAVTGSKTPSGVSVALGAAAASDDYLEGLDFLYRRHSLAIRRLIQRQFGSGPPDPDDAVQAAFERYARLEDKAKVEDAYAFLTRSARNFVLDHHRAAKVRRRHAQEAAHDTEGVDAFDAERVLTGRERLQVIDRAIREMDPRRREVLIMNRINGMSCADIARRLGCSPTLVKMRLAEAMVVCQRALRAADGDA